MATQSVQTETSSRTTRGPRRQAATSTDHHRTADATSGAAAPAAIGVADGRTSHPESVSPPWPGTPVAVTTLLFRVLLLTAAVVALAFAVAAATGAGSLPEADRTSPDAPPPAFFEQPAD